MIDRMIFPESLKHGDKVAILSPSSYIDPSRVDGAVAALCEWGFEPVVTPHCKGRNGSYSGTVGERLADLQWAVSEPSVRAILCSRGGYGAVQLLPHVDLRPLLDEPKWVIGFSDISAIHAALLSVGVASIHASMAKLLAERGAGDSCSMLLLDVLQGRLPHYNVASHPLNRRGEAVGMLVGGNLAVLSGLISTPYDIFKPGRILFIEDIGEEVYKVERMLHTLRLNGVLAGLQGLVVGRFTNYHSPDRNGETMEQMISRMVEPYGYPVAFDFPLGHVDDNRPLIEGCMARLLVGVSSVELCHLGI